MGPARRGGDVPPPGDLDGRVRSEARRAARRAWGHGLIPSGTSASCDRFGSDVSKLFEPLTLRGTTIRNRVWVSPMCQYSSHDGRPSDWHLVHLGAFARGGAGLVMSEATAVTPEGRISAQDAGIWNDEQAAGYRRINDFVKSQGATPGIQLAHAGRKASTRRPWVGRGYVPESEGGWQTVGASAIGYADWPAPRELTVEELATHSRTW